MHSASQVKYTRASPRMHIRHGYGPIIIITNYNSSTHLLRRTLVWIYILSFLIHIDLFVFTCT